jgi:Fe-S oxidoreductase
VKATKDAGKVARALERLTGASIMLNPGCCGESGAGAYTCPGIYNTLRERKRGNLQSALAGYDSEAPILVGCPSCKIGIARTLMTMDAANPARGKGQEVEQKQGEQPVIDTHRPVLHNSEWLARKLLGNNWLADLKAAGARDAKGHPAVRTVEMKKLG